MQWLTLNMKPCEWQNHLLEAQNPAIYKVGSMICNYLDDPHVLNVFLQYRRVILLSFSLAYEVKQTT